MQATLDASALKHLTKALTCLSKYGDDLTVYATKESFTLSATNSSFSAYGRFKYSHQFFSRYSVQDDPNLDQKDDTIRVSGQILVKSLLSILKHRTVEKTVDRCELTIIDGPAAQQLDVNDEDHDSLESKLIVRLHCKHGVIKTHRLLLLNAASLMVPSAPQSAEESRLNISARALKDLLDHFPIARGPKSDPQLVWSFTDDEVILKGLESSMDTNVKGQLMTELSISSSEFEVYDIYSPPITIAFHLREFLATIAFADSLALPLDMRFTEPAAPLVIETDGDLADTLFVMSTSEVHGEDDPLGGTVPRGESVRRSESVRNGASQYRADSVQRGRKRDFDDAEQEHEHDHAVPRAMLNSARKKPQKVVVRADRESVARDLQNNPRGRSSLNSMPPPSLPLPSNPFAPIPRESNSQMPPAPATPNARVPVPVPRAPEPLFLPGSQFSQALGIDSMEDFEAMLEDEGEEVDFPASQAPVIPVFAVGGPSRAGPTLADFAARKSADLDGSTGAAYQDVFMADVHAEEDEEKDELDQEDEPERNASFGLFDDDDGYTQIEATQGDSSSKVFRPLFDD